MPMMGRLRQERVLRDTTAALSASLAEAQTGAASEGIITGASWSAPDSTADVLSGDTLSTFGDDGDSLLIRRYPLATMQLGDAYGPTGNERAVTLQTQGGTVVLFVHGPDDAPAPPSGERWILHRNASGDIDAFIKHKNDGDTPGDGLGGAHYGGNANHSTFTTLSGHQVTLNDTDQTIQVTSASGHTVKIDDIAQTVQTRTVGGHSVTLDDVAQTITSLTAGGHRVALNDALQRILVLTSGGLSGDFDDAAQKITHLAGTAQTVLDELHSQAALIGPAGTGLGALFTALGGGRAAMVNADISTFETALHTQRLSDLTNMAAAIITAMTTSGVPRLPTATAIVNALASLAHIAVPDGSAIVRIAAS
jgi:hypothetical protein